MGLMLQHQLDVALLVGPWRARSDGGTPLEPRHKLRGCEAAARRTHTGCQSEAIVIPFDERGDPSTLVLRRLTVQSL
jgi:hypothetical protein